MVTDHCKQDCQALINAIAEDKEVYARLEQEGKLFDGYDPEMRAVHEHNAELLNDFLSQYGWPSISKYGTEVHEAAWFIAIHAISKPQILRYALQLLEKELKSGELVQNEYAKLFDRIALYEGRPQIYGTQFFPSPSGWYARNLLDPEKIDTRRASIGLPSFLEGKKECGADTGGFIQDAAQFEKYEKDYVLFLKEVGWQK